MYDGFQTSYREVNCERLSTWDAKYKACYSQFEENYDNMLILEGATKDHS